MSTRHQREDNVQRGTGMRGRQHQPGAILTGGPTLVGCVMILAILFLVLAIRTALAAWRPAEWQDMAAQASAGASLSAERDGPADTGPGLVSEPDLGWSQKTSSSPGLEVQAGSLLTYTIAVTNTGETTAQATITDLLGPYYTLHNTLDFTLQSTATLIWNGEIADQPVRLQYVVRVFEETLLPIGTTLLTNTAQVDDRVHDPFDIKDQAPPRVVRPSVVLLPAGLKAFTTDYFVDPYEPNDTFDQAYGPLQSNEAYSAYFPTEDDPDDFYWFEAASLSRIDIQLLVPEAVDLDLWVYDGDRNLVAGSSRIGPGLDESVRFRPEEVGRYYVRIYRFSGSSRVNPYTLVAGFGTPGRQDREIFVGR